ncbi:MAG: hypothetical protein WBP93_14725 [Pyrinomonadaceae bacterium]
MADVKAKRTYAPQREQTNGAPSRSSSSSDGGPRPAQQSSAAQSAAVQVRKRTPPPSETSAEIFYYKKQIDAHTVMVIVLQDGEEVEGTIEWYDKNALKVNRKTLPNLLLLKHNIKYMYKSEERNGKKETEVSSEK